ncbi:hypothetical protein [Faecalimonas umbilicata]|uniref:hypothetical protein n=1 Tax=Faecalimonas umbilicata TaxID=1912855 RepID=UPI003994E551
MTGSALLNLTVVLLYKRMIRKIPLLRNQLEVKQLTAAIRLACPGLKSNNQRHSTTECRVKHLAPTETEGSHLYHV